MHEATKRGQEHDNLQSRVIICSPFALYASTTVCETSPGHMQGSPERYMLNPLACIITLALHQPFL